MKYNLTFDLKSTSDEDLMKAVGAALRGDVETTRKLGGKVEIVVQDEITVQPRPQPPTSP